ncbi:phosphatase PAP2 family protein [Rhodococcus sp. NPDC059234]|uniref:phosphatase PAP2 family protein n=1 Tax=Rhodococcus sp. NPDC059234 TaxID=3346781 RepID=UPI00366F0E74
MHARLVTAPRNWPLGLAALIVAVGILGVFGPWDMSENPIIRASTSLYRSVDSTTATWPSGSGTLSDLVAEAGLFALAGMLALALWWGRGDTRTLAVGLAAGTGVVGSAIATLAVKSVITEERPCTAIPGVHALSECPPLGDWSFPSNHSGIAAAIATAVVLTSYAAGRVWLSVLAVLTALVVGASRVVSGVHYPHDVAAGLVFGTCIALAFAVALTPVTTMLVQRFVPVRGRTRSTPREPVSS